ncbi:guanylate-binding protein 6-like [Montipora capricornis]|uniref:guanylate-binding protein 6-like n=1 Tax=Montipora capricornis TaxID=246305 RepID=UPI0035F1B475
MEETWRRQYPSVEDEEEALARTLELSRLEYENNQGNSGTQREEPTQGAQALSEASPQEGHRWETYPVGEKDLPLQNIVKGESNTTRAIPLCLPNNCKWNSEVRDYFKTGEERSSLYVVEEALEKLREVKGPVCVVSIAGSYRKGKSYILSEAFDQPDVFPLGHELSAETMGIWLWIVPGKYKNSRGQEFSVVLLDSEGIDAATGDGRDDNQIFTLTVLLASVLIYNSQGVPTRRDLEGLDFIIKLSQRIQIRSNQGITSNREEKEFFHKTFPFFLWLLRDVTQSIPRDCKDLKDYFLIKVFKEQDSSLSKSQDAAESILRFFPGFDAFHLPPPSADDEVMRRIHEEKSQLRPQFLAKLEQFKSLLKSVLVPKHSCVDGQFVTGEGLAALVSLYVEAINTPGAIPNVQAAWETFVETKCFEAKRISQETYDGLMTTLLSDKMPCDNDEIRENHNFALEQCQRQFMAETTGMSTNTTERHLRQLKVSLNDKLNEWQAKNAQKTQEYCNDLLLQLRQTHLDPVLQCLQGSEGTKLTFDDIMAVYDLIKSDFDSTAVGAKDAIAATFFDFHEELRREKQHCLEILKKMENYDDKAAREIKRKAYQEQERRRLEEQQSRLQQENREHAEEMEMLIARLGEERAGLRQQMQSELAEHRVQMQNMMAANMRQVELEREEFMREYKASEERFLEMQRLNEESMRVIQHISELIAQHEKDKKALKANAEKLPQEELEGLLTELNGKQNEEIMALLEKAGEIRDPGRDEGKAEKTRGKKEEDLPQLINQRNERVTNLQQKIADTHQEQAKVEEESYTKKGLKMVGKLAPVIGEAAAVATGQPLAKPISKAVGIAAEFLSKECSIM